MQAEPIRCDIFCRVVDNYGDAAVCWRLARELAREHRWAVRLWIDDAAPLTRLAPDFRAGPVAVKAWPEAGAAAPALVVIEAFACELPASYVEAMAREARSPVWINLEYLSAEDWIDGCHALPSPHPRLPLTKHFFFPGFSAASGGLPREADYAERRAGFSAQDLRTEFGVPETEPECTTISLFSYPNPQLPTLIEQWANSPSPILLLRPGFDGSASRAGNLTMLPLPFLPQARYDELLWFCDLNFVRGEDSFVRAQLAAKPLIWHIYPQDADTHQIKLEAFLARYARDAKVSPGGTASDKAVSAFTAFTRAWNGAGQLDWRIFADHLPALTKTAQVWASHLAELPDLANNLAEFCRQKLK